MKQFEVSIHKEEGAMPLLFIYAPSIVRSWFKLTGIASKEENEENIHGAVVFFPFTITCTKTFKNTPVRTIDHERIHHIQIWELFKISFFILFMTYLTFLMVLDININLYVSLSLFIASFLVQPIIYGYFWLRNMIITKGNYKMSYLMNPFERDAYFYESKIEQRHPFSWSRFVKVKK